MHFGTAFLLGFAGSLHCAGMCGPLLLAMPIGPGSAGRQVYRRVLYQMGRVLTYTLLGLLAGGLGRSIGLGGFQRWVSIVTGALILIGLFAWPARTASAAVATPLRWLKTSFGRLLRQPTDLAQFLLGALNGLLPCGLVYAAVVLAAATGSAQTGGQYMLVFGLGTLPMQLGIALAGRYLHGWLQPKVRRFLPYSLAAMAALLILRGLSLGIPYLSPDLSGTDAANCCPPASSTPVDLPARH